MNVEVGHLSQANGDVDLVSAVADDDDEFGDTTARVMLSGGVVRSIPWIVTNRVVTDAGETIDWSFRVRVSDTPVRLRTKDPDSSEVLAVNWARKLGALTISSSAFVVPSGITKLFEDIDGQRARVKLMGATLGQEYLIKNTIGTSDSQTLVYRFVIRCVQV